MRAQDVGCRVQGSGFGVEGLGPGGSDVGFRGLGLRLRLESLSFTIWGSGLRT